MTAVGCAPPGPPLSRLVQAWAADTAEEASVPISATLVLAALASELCAVSILETWDEVETGNTLDVSPEVQEALGTPIIHSVELDASSVAQLVLKGVDIAGRDGQWLRMTLNSGEDGLAFEFSPLVDDGSTQTEWARLEGFGQISLRVNPDCTTERSVVGGSALWIDEENQRHEVKLPADQELGSDPVFGDDVPWLPVSGGISWSSRMDKQRRTITTEDAAEIRVMDTREARWPVVVHGPDWSGQALTTIAP